MSIAPTEWHDGEEAMHKLLRVPHLDNPTTPGLSAHAQRLLHLSSLLAIGIVDDEGRPWTTILGGEQGFARSLGQSIVGVKAVTDHQFDPVLSVLLKNDKSKSTVEGGQNGKDFSALGIHLATRDRVKLQGKMLAGGAVGNTNESKDQQQASSEIQMVFAIAGSLGNCPKYLNKKQFIPATPNPELISDTLPLSASALDLLSRADLFFITSHHPSHMSTNHRGGPPGFIRIQKNTPTETILTYPEYSGNRLYQTLGNLYLSPQAGLAIPDFTTGSILYVTGSTKILFGPDAAAVLPRSNLAVQIHVQGARHIESALACRALPGEPSPYNPPIRYLSTERQPTAPTPKTTTTKSTATARLLSRTNLTPTIARFAFSITDPAAAAAATWSAGQYVALSFSDELSGGYAHMDDADPKSLNDDYVRTFTVSSPPGGSGGSTKKGVGHDEFEITIRNVGTVTRWLFRCNVRAGLEVPLLGFGGTFRVEQPEEGEKEEQEVVAVPFVAGGIGITPLMAQAGELDMRRLRLFWGVNVRDLGLVRDVFGRYPGLGRVARVFVSGLGGGEEERAMWEGIEGAGAEVVRRRLLREDVSRAKGTGDRWYVCTGPAMRKELLEWLHDKETVYEDFDY